MKVVQRETHGKSEQIDSQNDGKKTGQFSDISGESNAGQHVRRKVTPAQVQQRWLKEKTDELRYSSLTVLLKEMWLVIMTLGKVRNRDSVVMHQIKVHGWP